MEPEVSLPCSRDPTTRPYPEPEESTSSYYPNIHAYTILPPTFKSS
jgi:hypothetical protein